jgi:hypothetical protein
VVSDWAACASPRAYDLSGQPDGAYAFLVRARDAAGNTGAAASSTYELDTVPGALAIDSAPGPLGREVRPEWRFSGEAGSTFSCRLTRAADVLVDWTTCTSPWSHDLASSGDAAYTFSVRSTDGAGNTGQPLARDYTLDTTPPGAPELLSRPPARARDRTPSWSFSGEEGAGLECRVERGSTVVADWSPCAGSFSANLAELEDGSYSFAVRAVDGAGNTGPAASSGYRLDTTPPDRPRIESSPGREGDDRTPRWGFRAEAGATLECRLTRGTKTVSDWEPCTSPQGYDLRAKPDDEYRFAVRATDAAGNRSAAATDDYALHARAADGPEPDAQDSAGGAPTDAGPSSAPPPEPAADPASPAAPPEPSADAKPGSDPGPKGPARGTESGANDGAGTGSAPGGRDGGDTAPGDRGGDGPERGGLDRVAHELTKQLARAAQAIVDHPDKSVFPLSLLFIVAGFLVVQGRLDRNDPKLALAPVFADPDLEFSPPPTKR